MGEDTPEDTRGPWVDISRLVKDVELTKPVELDVPHGYARVVEGSCPFGHGPLQRRDDCGWCEQCGCGWSVRGRVLRSHVPMEFDRLWLH